MIYFGFDLGDGESCITYSRDLSAHSPSAIPVNGEMSFASAVGMKDGELVVGSFAAGGQNVEDVRVCFKRHYLENNPQVDATIRNFVKGILVQLRQNSEIGHFVDDPDKACFIVGCPAGWKDADRKRYRELLTSAGMKNVRIASESRAAFENALRCNPDKVDIRLINDSVLVIDIGSSTLDLAYVQDGREHDVEVMGDVKLGGGLMDEMILQYALSQMPGQTGAELKAFLQENPGWYNRAMYKARELKEKYFTNEEYYFETNETLETVVPMFGRGKAYRLRLQLSPEIVETYVIAEPHPLLDMQSFESKLHNTLKQVHQSVKDREPKVVILTGGPSRMKFFQDMCRDEFKRSQIVISSEPELDISRGLCYAGSVDENTTRTLADLKEYIHSDAVEKKVQNSLPALINSLSTELADAMIRRCTIDALRKWKSRPGSATLNDLKHSITCETENFFASPKSEFLIAGVCLPWTKTLMNSVQQDLDEIAAKHNTSLDKLKHGSITVGGGGTTDDRIAASIAKMITTLVGVITSIVVAMICGGAGTALIVAGPIGIIIGIIIAGLAFFSGKDYLEGKIMELPVPSMVRGLLKESFLTREDHIAKTAASIRDNLTNKSDLGPELTRQVSEMIDKDLTSLLTGTESQIVA